METELAEEFKCPICLEVPPAAIHQCFAGHIVCESCSRSLTVCPQCRDKMPTSQKIRNRALENILDKLKFPCPTPECTELLTRGTLTSHSENCHLGGTLFNLCELLGSSCQFRCNSRALDSAFVHFKFFHKSCLVTRKRQGKFRLPKLSRIQRNVSSIWTPLFLDLRSADSDPICLLLCISYNAETSSINFSCLQMDESHSNLVCTLQIASCVAFLVNNRITKLRPLPVSKFGSVLKSSGFTCPLNEILESFTYKSTDTCTITWSVEDAKKPQFLVSSQESFNLENLPTGDHCLDYCTPHTPEDFTGDLCNCCDHSRSIYHKCLECEDWSICLQCKHNGHDTHPNHCFVVIWNENQFEAMNRMVMTHAGLVPFLPSDEIVSLTTPSKSFFCAQCKKHEPIKYVCLQCPESVGTICESCYLLRGHNISHCIAITSNTKQVEAILKRASDLNAYL